MCAKYWPLKGKLRLVGFPDAAYRNNADNSSQRGQVFLLVEERTVSKNGFGSMIGFESDKMNRAVLFTTASELYYILFKKLGLVNFFVVCGWTSVPRAWLFTCGLMLITWYTTASRTWVPEQKETVHMVQHATQGVVLWAT